MKGTNCACPELSAWAQLSTLLSRHSAGPCWQMAEQHCRQQGEAGLGLAMWRGRSKQAVRSPACRRARPARPESRACKHAALSGGSRRRTDVDLAFPQACSAGQQARRLKQG